MTAIQFVDVVKTYDRQRVVDRVQLTVASGELFFLLGPSGCGKTTLLRLLAGFLEPDAGDILLDGKSLRGVPPRLRNTILVFQNYALWPHRTVAANVAYGLEVRGWSRRDIAARVREVLRLVRLEALEDRRPTQLSGGQQQRVALARALAVQPRVLLLDEPLSNLDARLRLEMREEIRRLHQATGLTMLYVTHDQKEALSLADRIAVMNQGRIEQVGTPQEIYTRPRSRFVADFLGDCNFLRGTIRSVAPDSRGIVETPLGPVQGVFADGPGTVGQNATCAFRPEAVLLSDGSQLANSFRASVAVTTFLGETVAWRLRAGPVELHRLSLLGSDAAGLARPGAEVCLRIPPESVTILTE